MDEKKLLKSVNELMDDYLNLCEKYAGKLDTIELGVSLLTLVSQMILDCAPTRERGMIVIQNTVNNTYESKIGTFK